jgi:biotin transport system ATP-binding protein
VLVRHFNGLLQPTEGTVEVDGKPVADGSHHARLIVGLLFQDSDSQILAETVEADVAFGPRNLGLSSSEIARRVDEALGIVGLSALRDCHPHRLSGGEKRRLALAGVLSMKPKVVVFDEPFSNLDYPAVRQVLQQIVDLHAVGHTIVAITHEMDRILAHADRLILMDEGRIVRDGEPRELLNDLESFGVRKPPGSPPKIEALSWLS